jgi:hypothetical protein
MNVPNQTKRLRGVNSVNLAPMKANMKDLVTFSQEEIQKISNAIVMQINLLAGQLFELHNNMNKVILFKPRGVYKFLSREYQNRIERNYGENILRHVVLTQDFSFPSEDFTG